MNAAVALDKGWSDRCVPDLKRIAGELLVVEAPLAVDRTQNADLIVLTMSAKTIACRMRRQRWSETNPFDITIRSKRPSGVDTELDKIIDGWGDLFVYGFADDLGHVFRWSALSLTKFRAALIRRGKRLSRCEMTNADGTGFLVLDARDERVRRCVVRTSPGFWETRERDGS